MQNSFLNAYTRTDGQNNLFFVLD